MKRNIRVQKVFYITVLNLIILMLLASCSTPEKVHKKLIGKWKVELAEFSTGEIIKDPEMVIVFEDTRYTVFTKGKENFSLDYKVKKDYISFYLETFWKGRKQGERLYFDNDDKISLELTDELNGVKIKLKYYLDRIKEEED